MVRGWVSCSSFQSEFYTERATPGKSRKSSLSAPRQTPHVAVSGFRTATHTAPFNLRLVCSGARKTSANMPRLHNPRFRSLGNLGKPSTSNSRAVSGVWTPHESRRVKSRILPHPVIKLHRQNQHSTCPSLGPLSYSQHPILPPIVSIYPKSLIPSKKKLFRRWAVMSAESAQRMAPP